MSDDDTTWRETGGDEALAAEYALGVLSAQDRAFVEQRMAQDAAFAARVDAWEGHFGPLSADTPEVKPQSQTKRIIDQALFGEIPPTTEVIRPGHAVADGLISRLWFWKAATLGALALAVGLGALQIAQLSIKEQDTPAARLAASLTSDKTTVRYVAVYDKDTRTIGMRRLEGVADAERDFELWVIPPNEPPISLGVVPKDGAIAISPSEEISAKIEAGAVFAITLEQAGGSPDGKPQGPVVAAGDLGRI